MDYDYLIVGSGLTGAVIARQLHDAGQRVLVIERRSHLGGNVFDSLHPSGIRYHTYGPHYFRTSSDKIWQYVNRFDNFLPFSATLCSLVDGNFEPWPVTAAYINKTVGPHWKPSFCGVPQNFEQASLSMMPKEIYEKFVKGYTQKQWGVPPESLEPGLAKRFEIRHGNDFRLKQDKYQGLPEHGYAYFTAQILAGIPTQLNCDFRSFQTDARPRHLTIYTGAIDQYFDYRLGRLQYRGQHREHQYFADRAEIQPSIQVNNPSELNGAHVRTLEWKHLLPENRRQECLGTLITKEVPFSPTDPDQYEYPFPDSSNKKLAEQYKELAAIESNEVLICGRLGEYRYLDMDQAIARALVISRRILAIKSVSAIHSAIATNTLSAQLIADTSASEARQLQIEGTDEGA